MLRRLAVSSFAALAVTCVVGPAAAQEGKRFGESGQFILSAERVSPLFAYSAATEKRTENNVETKSTITSTTSSLLWAPNRENLFYNVPRLAGDFTVIPNLTVGAAIGLYLTLGNTRESSQGSTSTSRDGAKTTAFTIAPRVGYIIPLADVISFWPRLGFSFSTVSTKSTDVDNNVTTETKTSQNQVAVHAEPMFVIHPIRHFGINVGPVLDIPLAGTATIETTRGATTQSRDTDTSQFHFGITAGLTGWF